MMNRLVRTIIVFTLAVPLTAVAQRSVAPPASIYSIGGSQFGPPPASIYSQPTQTGNLNFSGRFGNFNGFTPGVRPHHRRGDHGGGFTGAPILVPYAVYPYGDYTSDIVSPEQEIPNGGTFQRGDAEAEQFDNRVAPTMFENRSSERYRTLRDSGGRLSEDWRHGSRYIDERYPRDRREAERASEEPPRAPQEEAREVTPTVLIFRDGHRREITNYAIMGKTLFVLAGERAKIPVGELDVDATIAANEQRGVDFRVPKN